MKSWPIIRLSSIKYYTKIKFGGGSRMEIWVQGENNDMKFDCLRRVCWGFLKMHGLVSNCYPLDMLILKCQYLQYTKNKTLCKYLNVERKTRCQITNM